MEELNVTSPGVEKILAGLNPSKAAGPDGLPSRILKLLAPYFAPVLTFVFQPVSSDRHSTHGLENCQHNANLQEGR